MRAFSLIRFSLTQVAHFGNDKKASEDLLGQPHRSTGCRRATKVAVRQLKWGCFTRPPTRYPQPARMKSIP
jgi:hypothetical protein